MKKNKKEEKNNNLGKNKFEKKKIIIICSIILAIIIAIAIYKTVDYFKDKKVLEKSSIDLNSETYKGKKVEVKGNQVIIYEENGSKTIESVGSKDDELILATESIKNKFDITNVSIDKQAAKMTVTGDIAVKTDEYTKVVVSAKFYRDGKLSATSSNTINNIKKNKKYSFEMNFVGDYSDCSSIVEVEYVK